MHFRQGFCRKCHESNTITARLQSDISRDRRVSFRNSPTARNSLPGIERLLSREVQDKTKLFFHSERSDNMLSTESTNIHISWYAFSKGILTRKCHESNTVTASLQSDTSRDRVSFRNSPTARNSLPGI